MTDKPDLPKYKIPCEVYSRVVGYLRPVSSWNKAQQEQFNDRKPFDVDKNVEQSDYMYREPAVAPNEKKPRECPPPMADGKQECHRTIGGKGVVGRLIAKHSVTKRDEDKNER